MAKRPKVHGWNGEFLEVGFSKEEAILLRDIMGFLADHPDYRFVSRMGSPMTPDIELDKKRFKSEDEFIHAIADQLYKVVNARTRA